MARIGSVGRSERLGAERFFVVRGMASWRLVSLVAAVALTLAPEGSWADAGDLASNDIFPTDAMLYRAYDGTINLRTPIRVFLCWDGGRWEGSYFYRDRRLLLSLYDPMGDGATRDQKEMRNVSLRESPIVGNEGLTGRWEGVFDDEFRVFQGTWHSPDGKKRYPIRLTESAEDKSLRAQFYQFSSSWTQARGSIETRRENTVTIVQFDGKNEAVQRINATIREAATYYFVTWEWPKSGATPGAPMDARLREGYPFDALERAIRAEPIAPENLTIGRLGNDIHDMTVQPVHNEGGYVTVRLYVRSYQGGAHSNYTDHYLNFETATGRLLDLRRDVLKPGYEAPLALAADKELRRYLDLKPGTPLSDGPLDVDRIELNDNWYLSVGGIGFSYDPYDVASFAVGFVSYTLPWDVLKPWLRDGAPGPESK